jgi:hypothetical protein
MNSMDFLMVIILAFIIYMIYIYFLKKQRDYKYLHNEPKQKKTKSETVIENTIKNIKENMAKIFDKNENTYNNISKMSINNSKNNNLITTPKHKTKSKTKSKNKTKQNIKKTIKEEDKYDNYVDTQYNVNYVDTIKAIDTLTSTQKEIFNMCDMPVKSSEVDKNEVTNLVDAFIDELNKEIIKDIYENGQNDKTYKSGWDKSQEALGLPGSIYTKPAMKSKIKLIKIDYVEKHETDEENKFITVMMIQKKNVNEKMVIKVSFVVNKKDWNLDRDFFVENQNNFETSVQIENISTLGYLILGEDNKKSKHYFKAITDGKMFDQQEIIKELNRKKLSNSRETAMAIATRK